MAQGTLKIHTEKLLPIIKKWLYSDKEIFLRELVSNSCDALSKVAILREEKEIEGDESPLRVDISIDKENKTITIADTGIGMSGDEVERYIAQVAFSGAEEFLKQYEHREEKDRVIGHFGLGFYSAYMVASKVELETLSYRKGAEPVQWSCDGNTEYVLNPGTKENRGTSITLFIEEEEFLEEGRLSSLLHKYCNFLPYPIFLNGTQVNEKPPLWLKAPSDCTDEEYIEFYHSLHPFEPDPIFWVHLSIDYPFRLKGILYFPKIDHRFDFQKSHTKLYCNRVFVSDNCRDLLPEYLTILRGAIDSPDIPLNVSRSYLQMDKTVRSLGSHISKKVADRLSSIYRTDKETFKRQWADLELIIKLGILQDEKFYERAKDFLIWQNLTDEWTTIPEYLERRSEKIFYTQDIHSSFINFYREKGIEVLVANGHLDTPLINFLEMKLSPVKFQRVDGAIDPALLDAEKEQTALDSDGQTVSGKLAQFIQSALGKEGIDVEAKSLATEKLPAFLILDEQTRRMRESLALSGRHFPDKLNNKKTFVVNTNNKIVQAIERTQDKELAKEMIMHLFQLTELGQKELSPKELPSFVESSYALLEKLVK